MMQVMCAVVLLLPRTSRLSPRVRRSIVRAIAIIGDATILALDVVPLTFGLLTVVCDGNPLNPSQSASQP